MCTILLFTGLGLKTSMTSGALEKAAAKVANAKKRQALQNRRCRNCGGYDDDILIILATSVCVVCKTMRGTPDETIGTPEPSKN